jgi:hypothetical protein
LLTVLGVVVLVVAVFALKHPHKTATAAATSTRTPSPTRSSTPGASHSPTGTPTGTPAVTSSASSTPAGHSASSSTHPIPLVVLNNTTVHGLAEQAKATFQAGGWTVTSTGNLTNDILSTCAYYDPDAPGAQAAAEQLQAQFPGIKRVKPKFAGLPAGPIVVVLTPDYPTG